MGGASGAFWICQASGSLVVDRFVEIRSFGCAGEDMVRAGHRENWGPI